MKSEQEIKDVRLRLLRSLVDFGDAHGFAFRIAEGTPKELFMCGLGALAMANWTLELSRPDNLERTISCLEKHAKAEGTVAR